MCRHNTLDGIAHFLADLFVGLNGLSLIANAFASQFIPRLRHAELVGGQFGGIHPIKQVVFFGNGLACFDGCAS